MRAHQAYRDAPQCVCSPTGSLGVCRGPTSRVVTGTIPATMFVYTELLAHPNNQRLRAFLIPTQSQWSQVELATGTIRYSNTAWWAAISGLSFPHPRPPFCLLFCRIQAHAAAFTASLLLSTSVLPPLRQKKGDRSFCSGIYAWSSALSWFCTEAH